VADTAVVINPLNFLGNALAAFGLNMAVFFLIGKTSALSMNIAGVVKDWMLIGLSVLIFHSAVSSLNLFGYIIAFLAVCWYNYQKLQAMKGSSPPSPPRGSRASSNAGSPDEKTPLVVLNLEKEQKV
jgi:hypothetical protein